MFSPNANNIESYYNSRKQWQRVEFGLCWMVILVTTLSALDSFHNILIAYAKISVLSRAMAYLIDFLNAKRTYGTLPLWLVLHHIGVFSVHFVKVSFLPLDTKVQLSLFALASQSSHNTWTKKLSLHAYWANVVVGLVALAIIHATHKASFAATTYFLSLLLTTIGVMVLVMDKFKQVNIPIGYNKTNRKSGCEKQDMCMQPMFKMPSRRIMHARSA